jgi:RNA polymerase sigma-70 factor (ECF subfamily)
MRFGPSDVRLPLTIDLVEYLDSLYSYALVLSRNQADAEDLVQETCVRALRAMDRLRPDSNAKSWLFTILRNIWLNELRRRKIAPNVGDSDSDEYGANRVADSSKDPYAAYLTDSECERVRYAIEQLPVEFREVVLLREYEELSYEEIAAMLQCPVGTVMSRLARARSKLRELVEPATMPPSATKGADNMRDARRDIGRSG